MTLGKWIVLAASLGLLAGCSSQPKEAAPSAVAALQEVDGLLRACAGATGRAPARVADLARYRTTFPRACAAVESGDVVVLWGAALKGEGEAGKNDPLVAYEKGVPTDGGYVLLSGGTVKKMTAAEFGAAPKGTK